ncbi:MAG: hypothetical protein AAF629_05250 [Chloroflexota bacterium]
MNDILLTAEEEKSYEAFYTRRKQEALGELAMPQEELRFAQDLLSAVVNDGLTPDSDGGVSWFRKDGLDWTDPAAVEAMQQTMGQGKKRANRAASGGSNEGGLSDMLTGIGVLLAIILAGWWYFIGFGDGTTEVDAAAQTPTVVTEVDSKSTPTPLPTLEAELLADIVDASGVKTDLVVPRTLELGGVSFVVQPVKIKSGDWALPDDERAVSWVYGTVVNYVMGLEGTSENKSLLANLQASDEILLRMSTGPAYRFAYADAVRVAPQASEIFRQTRPGLTLVLMGSEDEDSRIVLRAVYLPDSELGLSALAEKPTTKLNQAVILNERLRLIPQKAYPIPDPNAPPGYVVLALDVLWQNLSQQTLQPTTFHHYLEADGLRFAPLIFENTSQTYPAIDTSIMPNEGVTTTLTYPIPESILREGSTWIFALDAVGIQTARVSMPAYQEPLRPRLKLLAVSYEQTTILATVEVGASLTETVIEANHLTVEGAIPDHLGSNFPWTVQANKPSIFSLRLRPTANIIQVKLGEQGFEILIE